MIRLLFGRLFQRSAQPAHRLPTVAAPIGYPASPLPKQPKKRGVAPEQYAAELAEYRRLMRTHFADVAAFRRRQCVSLGIKEYRWIGLGEPLMCDIAKRNHGKVFSYKKPPPEGHPQEGACNHEDWCRCLTRSIVKGFN